jgi:hypothetical protein
MAPMTQADIEGSWKDLLKRYLTRIEGFGWLISRAEKASLESDVAAYETILKAWVAGFRKLATNDETALVNPIVNLVKARAAAQGKLKDINIEAGGTRRNSEASSYRAECQTYI